VAEPILIWGAGAIGGTIGAYWARAGIDVVLVDVVPEHVAACRTTGLSIEGPVETFAVTVPAATPNELEGRFARVVLAVKAHDTGTALAALRPHLAPDGFVLSAQNGLNEIEISGQVGERRTMGAFVNFGADWLGPGKILRGNRGAVVVGEIDGEPRERTREMLELLRVFEPDAILTDNIWGFLWGKLAYGAMLFATALNMDSIADNFADPDRLPVWRKLGGEVMAAAAARGVTPVGFDGFDPESFAGSSSEERARKSVADLAAFNRDSAKTHSGVWRDLAVRKRRTEVDAQIGVIAKLSVEAGVDTPAIRRLVELVHDVEAGRRPQSRETFNELLSLCS
jgi:2-dehydropantoate 2-reductase